MRIVVNGEEKAVRPGATVSALLEEMALPASRIAVERNRGIVRKADYGTTVLADGDRIEIVTFVGGG